jgi:hypothetical protein
VASSAAAGQASEELHGNAELLVMLVMLHGVVRHGLNPGLVPLPQHPETSVSKPSLYAQLLWNSKLGSGCTWC